VYDLGKDAESLWQVWEVDGQVAGFEIKIKEREGEIFDDFYLNSFSNFINNIYQ